MPKISVVVPVYNVEGYLRECLDSVINQTLTDLEIICVDDGSTDSSLSILREYSERDPRVRVITKSNAGYGNTMNVGFDAAEGEYIGIVESDDYVDENMFSDLYSIAKKYDADIVKSNFYEFTTPKIEREKYVITPTDKRFFNTPLNSREHPFVFDFILNTWTGIYRRDFIKENGIRHNETPGASYQDNGFSFQTIALAKSIIFSDGAYYHYRQDNPNSSINSRGKVFCMCEEYDFIRRFVDKIGEDRLLLPYHSRRFYNYLYSYRRIASCYKLEFLKRFSDEFREDFEKCEFDARLLPKDDFLMLREIMDDPVEFYYRDNVEFLNRRLYALTEERNRIARELLGKKFKRRKNDGSRTYKSLSEEEKDEAILKAENDICELTRELRELKSMPEYKTAYQMLGKEPTLLGKLVRSLRENGLGKTFKKIIKRMK